MPFTVGPHEHGISTADEQRDAQIAALQRERAGLAMRGLKDRVAAVDAEIARLTPEPEGEPEQAAEQPEGEPEQAVVSPKRSRKS